MKVGDVVYFNRKKYYVMSVMEHPSANWVCAISKNLDDYCLDWKTVFKSDIDKLKLTIQNEQLSIFEMGEL